MAAACLVALLLAACGNDPATAPGLGAEPPPVTLRFGDESVMLKAHTYCFGNVCADGEVPANPHDVGSPAEVLISFPLDKWSFGATFSPVGVDCGRQQSVDVKRDDDGTLRLRPIGRAGTYDVTLFGRGDGDLSTVFRWSTPTSGPMPEPKAELAVLAERDGDVKSYGVELGVSDLAATPKHAAATITVTATNHDSLTIEPTLRTGCLGEGTVAWEGPERTGLDAARLGPPPFTYQVVLILDGVRYVATAQWPRDVIPGNEPSVALRFTPALPAL